MVSITEKTLGVVRRKVYGKCGKVRIGFGTSVQYMVETVVVNYGDVVVVVGGGERRVGRGEVVGWGGGEENVFFGSVEVVFVGGTEVLVQEKNPPPWNSCPLRRA